MSLFSKVALELCYASHPFSVHFFKKFLWGKQNLLFTSLFFFFLIYDCGHDFQAHVAMWVHSILGCISSLSFFFSFLLNCPFTIHLSFHISFFWWPFITDVSQLVRGSSLISKLHMGINFYPDVVLWPLQSNSVLNTDYFHSVDWIQTLGLAIWTLFHHGWCLKVVFGHSHCSSTGIAQLPIGRNSSDSHPS